MASMHIRDADMGGGEEEVLIPGLPDDVGLDCLARVPVRWHARLRHVCGRWRDLVTDPVFQCHRERIGAVEDLIYLVQAMVPLPHDEAAGGGGEHKAEDRIRPPEYGIHVYNATSGEWWRAAAPAPAFAQVAAAGREVVVVGGWDPATLDPAAEVRIHDPATGTWRRGQAMPAPARSFFACAGDPAPTRRRVYVSGGHDANKNALRSAAAYDVAADEWSPMAEMGDERDESQGVVVTGCGFWAVSGYGTEGQGRFENGAEWYDDEAKEWRKEEGIFPAAEGGAAAACFVGVKGRIWSVECGRGVREYEGRGKGWRVVAATPEGLKSSPRAVAIGEAEKLFVIGATEDGRCKGWVLEAASGRWTPAETPAEFSGFVYSAAAIRR
ncbi:F-box/kelch-repeat protein SKIP20-like [Typha angustifolia]|uniref:F-box/kelch-repeat protein SKIP20-like n=1 Tax=Typha angustifolia TaxID=59011 RepID=UPI003C2E3B5A